MPKAIVSNASLIGKTIARVADTWHVNGYWRVLVFTDGSFYATDNKNEPIYATYGKDVDVNEASIAKKVREMAVGAALIPQTLYDTQLELEKAELAQQFEDVDRREYERLKARFEGKENNADDRKKRPGRTAARSHRTRTPQSRLADNQGAVETLPARGHTLP